MITNIILYVLGAVFVAYIVMLEHRATSTYVAAFKKYLNKAVIEAEMVYGAKTGKLKFITTQAEALSTYPLIRLLLDSTEIDEAIEDAVLNMKELIANDEACAEVINSCLFILESEE